MYLTYSEEFFRGNDKEKSKFLLDELNRIKEIQVFPKVKINEKMMRDELIVDISIEHTDLHSQLIFSNELFGIQSKLISYEEQLKIKKIKIDNAIEKLAIDYIKRGQDYWLGKHKTLG